MNVRGLQVWIRQPEFASRETKTEGCDMMMRLLREAKFLSLRAKGSQRSSNCSTQAHRRRSACISYNPPCKEVDCGGGHVFTGRGRSEWPGGHFGLGHWYLAPAVRICILLIE